MKTHHVPGTHQTLVLKRVFDPALARPSMRPQKGVALVFVLIMMSIIFVMAAVTSRVASMGERASRNDRDRQIAFQAAEAALSDAELDIMGPGSAGASRVGVFWDYPTSDGCSSSSTTRGLCTQLIPQSGDSDLRQMYLRVFDVAPDDSDRGYVLFGEYTGRTDDFSVAGASNPGALPALLPRYIVEKTSLSFRNRFATAGKPMNAFVVTAVGYGIQPTTQVVLQALISKPVATE